MAAIAEKLAIQSAVLPAAISAAKAAKGSASCEAEIQFALGNNPAN